MGSRAIAYSARKPATGIDSHRSQRRWHTRDDRRQRHESALAVIVDSGSLAVTPKSTRARALFRRDGINTDTNYHAGGNEDDALTHHGVPHSRSASRPA